MNEAEKAYQYFVIAIPENAEQAKAYFWTRKALQFTLATPNQWVSVKDRLPSEVCKYQKAMAKLFDSHFLNEDCPMYQKCSFGENHAENKKNHISR